MANPFNEFQFVISAHELYARYEDDWRLAIKSYYGGPEYRMGEYLKQFDSVITTHPVKLLTHTI